MLAFRDPALKVSAIGPWVLIAGLLLFGLSAFLVDPQETDPWEEAVFRFFFGLPDGLELMFRIATGLAMLALVILVALYCWVNRDALRAALAVVALALAFAVTYATKLWIVARGRPAELLAIMPRDVTDPNPIGFPSGHMAVTVTLTLIAFYLLSPPYRLWLWPAPLVIAAGRLYIGEHMPLDLVGGVGIGLVVGSVAELATHLRRRTTVTTG